MAEKPIIEVQGLTKRFKGLTAVHDVSFSVEKGSITGMIGPNGAGKSTTFNMICGYYPPTEGKANLVEPMMIAAVAAGADGLEVEVHYDPQHAWSDGAQCLTPDAFAQAMAKCRQVAWAIGREM